MRTLFKVRAQAEESATAEIVCEINQIEDRPEPETDLGQDESVSFLLVLLRALAVWTT